MGYGSFTYGDASFGSETQTTVTLSTNSASAQASGGDTAIDATLKEIIEISNFAIGAATGGQTSISGITKSATSSATASFDGGTIELDLGQNETFEVPVKAEMQSSGGEASISGSTTTLTSTASVSAQPGQAGISGTTTAETSDFPQITGTPTPVYREIINFENGVIQDDTNVVGNELQQFGNEDNINVQSQDVISGNFSLKILNDGNSTDEALAKTAIRRGMDILETSFKTDGVSEITTETVFGTLTLRYEPQGKGDQITISNDVGFNGTTKQIISGVSESTVYDVRFEFFLRKEEANVIVNGSSETIEIRTAEAEEIQSMTWTSLTDNKKLIVDDISLELFEDANITGTTTATASTSTVSLSGGQTAIDLAQKETFEVPSTAAASATGGTGAGIKLVLQPKGADIEAEGAETDTNVIGTDGDVDVLIEGEKIAAYTNIELKKRLNEVDTFKFEAFIEDNDDRALIQEGNIVKFVEGYNDLLFKGVLNEVEYKSSFRAVCEGNGMEQKLLNRKTERETFTNSSGDAIVKDVVPTSVISRGVIESAPQVSVRFDHDNLARAVAGVANATGYDWYVDQEKGDGFDEDFLNFEASAGSDTTKETYEIGNNARLVERNKDEGFIANDITLLGRGDGINQLEANVFAASSAFTDTTETVDETSVSNINVKDATALGSVGDNLLVRLGTEVLDVNISDSTTLTVDGRGLNNFKGEKTEKIKHFKNVRVWRIENITQGHGRFTPENRSTAEDGSSIEQFGVREQRETDKTIVDISTLEKAADLELKNRFEDIFRVQVKPTEPRTTKKLDLGDNVDVKDLTAMDVDNTFQITGIDAQRASAGEGTTLHLANRPRRLTERLRDIESNTDTLNAHMQGATNLAPINFNDNADNDNPLASSLRIPKDAVAVNKVDVTAKRESFRGYVQNQAHSHDVDIGTQTTVSSETGEFINTGQNIASEGTIINDPFVNIEVPSSPTGSDQGVVVTAVIFNQTGQQRNYDLDIVNISDNDTLDQETVTLDANSLATFNFRYDPADLDSGDFVELDIEGDLETETENSLNSYIEIIAASKSEHQHDVDIGTQTSKSAGAPEYGIFQPNTEPAIDIDLVVDGNTVKTFNNVSVGDEIGPIDVNTSLSEPLAGEYHEIKLVPKDAGGGENGRCRLNTDVNGKIFIESTLQ